MTKKRQTRNASIVHPAYAGTKKPKMKKKIQKFALQINPHRIHSTWWTRIDSIRLHANVSSKGSKTQPQTITTAEKHSFFQRHKQENS